MAQKYGWPCISSGVDVTLVSPSGTGKTLAYLLPLLTKLEGNQDISGVSMVVLELQISSCVCFIALQY